MPTNSTPRRTATESPSYLGRILDLLELAVTEGPALSLSDLAERAGVPLSTASRQVGQLKSWGFLVETEEGRFVPGSRLVAMSAAIAEWLHSDRRLLEATRALTAATTESATAGRLVGDKVFIVARTEPDRPLRAVNRTGELVPPSRSAMGKAILCWLPRNRQLDLLRAEGVADPEGVLSGLADELAVARHVGYAVDEETLTVGLRCRASAIRDWDGVPVAALAVSGPTARFSVPLADASVSALIQEVKTITSGEQP